MNMLTDEELKRVKCPDCKGWMNMTKVKLYGFPVRAWKCEKCDAMDFDALDTDRARLLRNLKENPLVVIAKEMTESTYIRFPKKYAGLVPVGTQVKITPKDEDELILKINNV